jgi:hypothetical protein
MAYKSQPTITRPANTTAYSAGDVVGGAFQLVGLPEGGNRSLLITSADLRVNVAAIPSGMTSFRAYLYRTKPASDLADNAAWDLPAGDRADYIGYVDLGSPADLGSTLFCQVDQINKHIYSGPAGVWAYLVTNGGFTPAANSEEYVPTVRAIDFNA